MGGEGRADGTEETFVDLGRMNELATYTRRGTDSGPARQLGGIPEDVLVRLTEEVRGRLVSLEDHEVLSKDAGALMHGGKQ